MSLYKDASLVMIPSAYKDGKLYSIRPTDGSGDFTFSRGSNLAATRVDVNGLIEKGRENLLTYSNDFSQGVWNKDSGASVSSGEVGYDGSNDAWRLNKGSLEGPRLRYNISLSNVHTGSIYVKAGSLDYFRVDLFSGTRVCFDLVNGEVVFNENEVDATITSAGNGWWKVSVTRASSIIYYMIYPANSDATFGGTGTDAGYIYIQDAQLEAGLVATDYIETGASTAQAGILEDMPRLDYSGGASCPALLLEPQRTNLIDHSEYLDGLLDVANGSVSYNTAVSPEGLTNSALYTEDSSTNAHYIDSNTFSFTSGVDYVISVFAKYNGRFLTIQGSSGRISSSYGTFNLQTGVVEEDNIGTASIENYGNGWYRCSLKVTAFSTGNGVVTLLLNDSATGGRSRSYTGDGTSGLYYYGFQAEAGSYPTSYIPTYGSSVTRSGDVPSVDSLQSNDIFGSTQGTAILQFTFDASGYIFDFNDTIATRIRIYNAGSNNWYIRDLVGAKWYFPNLTYTDGVEVKIAIRWDGSEVVAFQDGVKSSSSSTFTEDITIDRLATIKTNNTKQITLFPTALTDSECIALTTL